jgi:hypothetical protein
MIHYQDDKLVVIDVSVAGSTLYPYEEWRDR